MNRMDILKNYLQDSPDDSFLKHALALEYVKHGNDVEAEKLFREILNRQQNYIGSYYHLAKLLERKGKYREALDVYMTGMEMAKAADEPHAYNELKNACDELHIRHN